MNQPPIDDLWSQVGLLINDLLPLFPPGAILTVLWWVEKHFQLFRRAVAIGAAVTSERKPTPTNGNGNGNYTLLSQSLDMTSTYAKSLEKRLEDFMESQEQAREEDLRYRQERENSWLMSYKNLEKEKRAATDTIERLAETNKRYEATLKRVDETLTLHGNQIVEIQNRNVQADEKLSEVETTTKTILEIVQRLENKAA